MSSRPIAIWCWQTAPDTVVARVAFCGSSGRAGYSAVRKSGPAAIAAVKEELERVELPVVEAEDPQYRRMTVEIFPSRARAVKAPGKGAGRGLNKAGLGASTKGEPERVATTKGVDLAVDVAYSRIDDDLYVVEIAQTRDVFHVHDLAMLPALVPHLVREGLANADPTVIFAHMRRPAPTLNKTQLREPKAQRAGAGSKMDRVNAIAELVTGPDPSALGAWERAGPIATTRWMMANGSMLIIGGPRVGRTTILAEAVRQLRGKPKVYRTHARRMTAGAKYLGEWQQLVDQLVGELEGEESVLWIDDIAQLAQEGGATPEESVAAYLVPAMKRGLRLCGELTPTEFSALQTRLPAFAERFMPCRVEPLSTGALNTVLVQACASLSMRRGVVIEPKAGELALRLLERYVRYEAFPGKLIPFLVDLVDEAVRAGQSEPVRVDDACVLALFSRRTGIPQDLLDDHVGLDVAAARAFLEKRVVAQDAAVDAAIRTIRALKAGLNDPAKPVATLLFAGPTGVGKTASARALAEWCFGSDAALIRVDMSECQHPAGLARLIGLPGADPGDLVRRVREKPLSVVLFDEIEKAHPAFFDMLLTVLDEGTMTDANGRVTDFRGCMLLLTTNLGTRSRASLGFGGGAGSPVDLGAIRRHFRPEFLNRLDQIVPFAALGESTVRAIAERELAAICKRPGFAERGVQFLFSEALVDKVVKAGFDPVLGARPLLRVIEQVVVAALARYLLDQALAERAVLVVELSETGGVVGG